MSGLGHLVERTVFVARSRDVLLPGARHQFEIEEAFVAGSHQRQQAMRRNALDRFGVVEIVAVLGAFGLLAIDDLGADQGAVPEPVADLPDQGRIFAPAFHQDGAGAIERSLGIGYALLGIDISRGFRLRVAGRITGQRVGQRF